MLSETLETRRLLSAAIVGNTLLVQGTAEPNNLVVNQISPVSFSIFQDGATLTLTSTNPLRQIRVNGLGGDDFIVILPSVTLATTLTGGAGDDTFIGGSGRDLMDGGADEDTADYSGRVENLRLSANGVADDAAFGERDNIGTSVENILGGSGNDLILASLVAGSASVIDGGAGNDDIWGGSGGDLLLGGEGNDSIHGLGGDDYIAGNLGNDQLLGDDGNDVFELNDGAVDFVVGGNGYDTAYVDSFDNWASDVENVLFT